MCNKRCDSRERTQLTKFSSLPLMLFRGVVKEGTCQMYLKL